MNALSPASISLKRLAPKCAHGRCGRCRAISFAVYGIEAFSHGRQAAA